MKLGITGTRNGFSKAQENVFKTILKQEFLIDGADVESFHQGQCIGVDVESAELVHKLSKGEIKIHSHPPLKHEVLGASVTDVVHPAKNYFARNRDIANTADILFVCPPTEEEQSNGGTWYTYRYALDRGVKIILITPKGVLTRLNF